MARTPFQVEILSPEGEVFNDEVEMLSTRTAVGSIGVLAHHQPLLALLEPTELRLYKSESDVVTFAQGEGYLQMTGERALVLVDEVFDARPARRLRHPRAPLAGREGPRGRGGGHGGGADRQALREALRGLPEARREPLRGPRAPGGRPLSCPGWTSGR